MRQRACALLGLAALLSCAALGPKDISSADAHRLVAAGAKLVDVRSPEEYAGGHIEGAVNIPVGEVPGRLGEFGPKDQDVVVYCRSGRRSSHAAKVLREAGWTKVHNLGGMGNW